MLVKSEAKAALPGLWLRGIRNTGSQNWVPDFGAPVSSQFWGNTGLRIYLVPKESESEAYYIAAQGPELGEPKP